MENEIKRLENRLATTTNVISAVILKLKINKLKNKFGYPKQGSYIYRVKLKVMFKKFRNKFKQEIDTVGSFLFIALMFYLLYFSLWVFCPC